MLLNWTRVWEYPAIADAIITPIVMLHRCIAVRLPGLGNASIYDYVAIGQATRRPKSPVCDSISRPMRGNELRYFTALARIFGKSFFAESLTKEFGSSRSASACGRARRWSAGGRISRQANNA